MHDEHPPTTARSRLARALSLTPALAITLAITLAIAACDAPEAAPPSCDELTWELGIDPDPGLPIADFQVRCVAGSWATKLETRPPATTQALSPARDVHLHPQGGYLLAPAVDQDDPEAGWGPLLVAHGLPLTIGTIWVSDDLTTIHWGSEATGVIVGEGGQLWGFERPEGEPPRLVEVDPATGLVLGVSAWEAPEPSRMVAARGAPGVWITSGDPSPKDVPTTRRLHRAIALDQPLELAAEISGPAMDLGPDDRLVALSDGGVAWSLRDGALRIHGPDGALRWSWQGVGAPVASEDDGAGLLVADGAPMRLAYLDLADGATLWKESYQRYEFAEPCADAPGCFNSDGPDALLRRPGGGWYLIGHDTWPSHACGEQPLVLALDGEGAGLWGHRVDVCGLARGVGVAGDELVIQGDTLDLEGDPAGSWLRRIAP
ncbi:MAG: hypothetical protein H6711_09865 [Myxococcales bacterium]|nr:hypothetical protein [Myxococcales bacterium]